MQQYSVWNSVKVTAPKHARTGQAGVVYNIDPKDDDTVGVKFDSDGKVEVVKVADLASLG